MSREAGRVAVAMSGGVDSSVAAAILKEQGHEVVGVMMQLWSGENSDPAGDRRGSPFADEIEAAQSVCSALDIPFSVVDFEPAFRAEVVDPFCGEYLRGRTPNPCIACNQRMKFGLLLRLALDLGVDYLATGHYARVERLGASYSLLKGVDPAKDQSYLLYTLGQWELERILLPMGDFHKEQSRDIARRLGLPVWDKADSREICFIPDGDYRSFLSARCESQPGEIVDTGGRVVGRHSGIASYTVGQRRGLGLSASEPLYVVSVNASDSRLVVGTKAELLHSTLSAGDVFFIQGEPPRQPTWVTAKIRYRAPEARALLYPRDGRAMLKFDRPQQAITPGQAVVFYSGDVVLGGGIIESATDREPVATA